MSDQDRPIIIETSSGKRFVHPGDTARAAEYILSLEQQLDAEPPHQTLTAEQCDAAIEFLKRFPKRYESKNCEHCGSWYQERKGTHR